MTVEKKTEMSLDEVLSSIKKMVVDEDPPVLELTDMVSEDGSIVNIKKESGNIKSTDMSSFLRLIQENADNKKHDQYINNHNENISQKRMNNSSPVIDKNQNLLIDIVKSTLHPILTRWIDENLKIIVTEIVREEIEKALYNNSRK